MMARPETKALQNAQELKRSGPRPKASFIAATSFDKVPRVTLYDSTWNEHIVKRHIELMGKLADVETVISSVTTVISGSPMSNPDYVVFLNRSVTSPGGTPLGVIVDTTTGEVCTAYYNRRFKIIDPSKVLWSR